MSDPIDRRDRLARSLRANLHRRKDQARARASLETSIVGSVGGRNQAFAPEPRDSIAGHADGAEDGLPNEGIEEGSNDKPDIP